MKPLIQIGYVLVSAVTDAQRLDTYRRASELVHHVLSRQFTDYQWQVDFIIRHRYPPHGALDPLELLEVGVQEKIKNRWDYAMVLVSNELKARYRISTIGVPSSAFEVGVLSSYEMNEYGEMDKKLASLSLHLLGHLWGLSHSQQGPMVPPERTDDLSLSFFTETQQQSISRRLEEAADARLEEEDRKRSKLLFFWHTFWSDPRGILQGIWGYSPWKLPLKMGRMTAAAAVSLLFLLLGAESWDMGIHFCPISLVTGSIVSLLGATIFIYYGQNLGQISRQIGLREQLVRTRIVIFNTLLIGMCFLWLFLFVLILGIGMFLPEMVIESWLGGTGIKLVHLVKYSAFMGIIGVLAGAMGGNLEEEEEIKADLFYDEET